jgi:uncharacterized membrane protein
MQALQGIRQAAGTAQQVRPLLGNWRRSMITLRQPAEQVERLSVAMVEATTEYDWAELPDYLQARIRRTAYEFLDWQHQQVQPIRGEVVT